MIDFENVQPEIFALFEQEHFKLMVFVGANQARLPYEIVAAIQRLGNKAEYVKISGNGSNSLDFHIAFYIGHIASTDPTAYFHIISKDTGFDPLIQHLKSKKIFAARAKDISEIPFIKMANSNSSQERAELVVAKFHNVNKPRTLKTLANTIRAIFHKQLPEDEVMKIIETLKSQGILKINDMKVSYDLPPKDA
jgi:hypothetical protein